MTSDLNFDVEIVVAPIVREPGGLAMSSRNVYLNPEEKKDALVLRKSLELAERMVRKGERDARKLLQSMETLIRSKKTAQLDYVAIADSESLAPIEKFRSGQKVLVAVAARIGKTRLIDSTLIDL